MMSRKDLFRLVSAKEAANLKEKKKFYKPSVAGISAIVQVGTLHYYRTIAMG